MALSATVRMRCNLGGDGMKKLILLILALAMLLSGCSWLDGEYHSVKPHTAQSGKPSNNVIVVTDYLQLRDALVDMVNSGKQKASFYSSGFSSDEVDQHMKTAIMHLFQNCALGAYAVEEVTYEAGISGDLTAIAVTVNYIQGRQEIQRIKKVANMDGLKDMVRFAVNHCDASTVIRVSEYKDMDVQLFVQEYANENPHLCMEIPQVTVNTYPERGKERVVEISFAYTTSRDALRTMQNMVAPIFSAAELYVQGSEEELQKYEQLYAFLMERFDYQIETSITPAYSLLRYGVGDSKAFAMVYMVMCQNTDLQCQVVSGTRNGEAYYWNLIRVDDTEYHVDLLASSKAGEFLLMLPEEMSGYVWDYSLYQ